MLYKDCYYVNKSEKNYFEGYYVRLINERINLAIIFGISKSSDAHSFIQVYDGNQKVMEYFRFSSSAFYASSTSFDVVIEGNSLNEKGLILKLNGQNIELDVAVQFKFFRTLKETKYKTIMGPVGLLPKLECYHGVVSMWHEWNGYVNGENLNGYSYIEKDYGTSMPSNWVWIHLTNETGDSFMFSLAKIPYLGFEPKGFLGFYSTSNKSDVFGSYTLAKYEILKLNEKTVHIQVENKKYRFVICIDRRETVFLKAPKNGMMQRDIEESLGSRAQLIVYDKHAHNEHVIDFENVACEVVGGEFVK